MRGASETNLNWKRRENDQADLTLPHDTATANNPRHMERFLVSHNFHIILLTFVEPKQN